jgi:hypothetical protein
LIGKKETVSVTLSNDASIDVRPEQAKVAIIAAPAPMSRQAERAGKVRAKKVVIRSEG